MSMSFFSRGIKTGHSTPDTVSQVPDRGKDQFPGPADYTLVKTARNTVGSLCCKDTLLCVQLIHVQLVVHQASLMHFFKAAAYTVVPQRVLLNGVIPS